MKAVALQMHVRVKLILPIVAVALIGSAAAREPTSGSSLWTGCSADFFSQAYYESYAACRAYVIGVADVLSAGDSIGAHRACIPDNASKADITETVIGWLEAHPSPLNDKAAHALVAEAISIAYPCN